MIRTARDESGKLGIDLGCEMDYLLRLKGRPNEVGALAATRSMEEATPMNERIQARMRDAATTWGREQLGTSARVIEQSKPIEQEDGSLRSTATVCCEEAAQPRKTVACFITLEPDGRISCYSSGAEAE